MGKKGVANLQWKNHAGRFQIISNGLPIDKIGLNPALANLTLVLGLQITPEASQQYIGTSRFEVFKKSATQFLRNAKVKL